MRIFPIFASAMIIMGLGLTGCAEDDPAPGDGLEAPELKEISPESSEPALEGEFDGDEYQELACRVKLVYCRDPRWTPHYPSYCSNGCTAKRALDAAYSLCRKICGRISCSPLYTLGSC